MKSFSFDFIIVEWIKVRKPEAQEPDNQTRNSLNDSFGPGGLLPFSIIKI